MAILVNYQFIGKHIEPYAPAYNHVGDAGFDFRADVPEKIVVQPSQTVVIPTGLCFDMGRGVELQVRSRSGLAAKNSVQVLNSPGTVDSGYRGEIKVILRNSGKGVFVVEPGMRIAQGVFSEYLEANFVPGEITESERGSAGFGSTGTK